MNTVIYIILVILAVVIIMFFLLGKLSQKGKAAGLKNGKLSPCSTKPNCVCSEEGTQGRAKIKPLSASVWGALKTEIINQGGQITNENDEYFSAEFCSNIFKFVDDFEARLDGDVVHIRSSSRVGYSDRGVNRKRIEALRISLQTGA
ncbi:MAG: DUF1499 domain-containing protein [Robiginitomaculum sp.]|nr:DUF1499 domain-containing protein [Robiginitomaculum sp.]